MELGEMLALLRDATDEDHALVTKAYHFAKAAHRPQRRKSGEPYFVHVASVAAILAQMGMDAQTVAAGLLHDTVEDVKHVTVGVLRSEFGDEIAHLVDAVTHLDRVSSDPNDAHRMTEAEYLRKTITAMHDDVRVILIKLADRLHNMQTLSFLKQHRQLAIAQETLDLFAPMANRLGMRDLKSKLEDLSFRYLEPELYAGIEYKIREHELQSSPLILENMAELHAELAQHGIQAEVKRHPLRLYSIYSEMKGKKIPFEETFGVRGIRIITQDTLDCYQALGVVHQLWRPIPGSFDDFIAVPRDRFYQSLHTSVFGANGACFTVQIRTADMDRDAEHGVAAAWYYRQRDPAHFRQLLEKRLAYLRSLIEPAQGEETPEGFVQSVIENINSNRVYVLTPQGDRIDLPRGSTPIDFAYHIHTEIGHRCRGARVNGRLVMLDYKIKTGDQVEIYTTKRGGPKLEWLDQRLGYTYSNRARSKIRAWFRAQGREKLIQNGQEVLDQELRQMGLPPHQYEDLRHFTHYQTVEDMLAAIGMGSLSAADIVAQKLDSMAAETITLRPSKALPITGARGYTVRLARCCRPKPDDEIIGYVTREAQVSVHRVDCPILNNRNDIAERLILVSWPPRSTAHVFPVPVELRTLNRAGMMGEIGAVVAGENINMSDVNILTESDTAIFHVTMEIDSFASLSRVLTKIKTLDGVIEARRAPSHELKRQP